MKGSGNIFLIGFMGSGKSTVAAKLHQLYGMKTIEMDQLIEERQKMRISEIFNRYGEAYFRDLETDLLEEVCAGRKQVVSCGGGVALRAENVEKMKKGGWVVLLTADAQTILNRVMKKNDRPILEGKKNVRDIGELMEKRRESYERAADFSVNTDARSVLSICEEIMQKIKETEE